MAKPMVKTAPSDAERLSGRDWITAALREIGRAGVPSVRIEAIARDLGVTKGSFYWHFKDRNALLVEVLRFWRESSTTKIAKFVAHMADAQERLGFLVRLASEDRPDVPGGPIEHALREWARSSEIARRTLAEVDNERLAVIAKIYVDLGMSPPRAKAAALLALSHLIGVNVIHSEVGRQATRLQREICTEYLMRLPELAS